MAGSETQGPAADAGAPPPLPSPERLQELLFDAARMGRDDMIVPLLKAGADIEAQDGKGHSALVLASYNGQEGTVALLLNLGALVDGPPDTSGNTALMGVAFKGHTAIAMRLLAAGAQPDRRNRAGQTALMMAALFGRESVMQALLEHGADPALQDHSGNCAAALAQAQGNFAVAQLLEVASARKGAGTLSM